MIPATTAAVLASGLILRAAGACALCLVALIFGFVIDRWIGTLGEI